MRSEWCMWRSIQFHLYLLCPLSFLLYHFFSLPLSPSFPLLFSFDERKIQMKDGTNCEGGYAVGDCVQWQCRTGQCVPAPKKQGLVCVSPLNYIYNPHKTIRYINVVLYILELMTSSHVMTYSLFFLFLSFH